MPRRAAYWTSRAHVLQLLIVANSSLCHLIGRHAGVLWEWVLVDEAHLELGWELEGVTKVLWQSRLRCTIIIVVSTLKQCGYVMCRGGWRDQSKTY